MTPEPADYTPPPRRPAAWWWLVVAGAAVVGIVIGRSIPPPVPDGQWWATYLLSPGFGGTAAFFAAAIAGGIAWRNSAKDRKQRQLAEQRSQWWDRFTWATEKAIDHGEGIVSGVSTTVCPRKGAIRRSVRWVESPIRLNASRTVEAST